jgi:hypothetical protein
MRCIRLVAFAATISVAPAFSQQPHSTPQHVVSHILRQPVESSAISNVGYSKHLQILEVEFVNGAIYRYLDVAPAVYRDVLAAKSKARFYDMNIKGHYRSIRVRAPQKEQVRAQ